MEETSVYGHADDDTVANGGIGDDIISSGGGNDILGGGAGNDTLNGGGGSDRLNGGSGNDTLIYNLSENAGATDQYMGGYGLDTVRLELTLAQWESAIVQQEIREYLQHLATVKKNVNTGEVSNGSASDFTFNFGGGTALTVSMMEKLVVVVNGEVIDPHAPFITSNGAGQNAAISIAENTTAVTTVAAFDIDAGTTVSYSIVGGADAGKFTIDASTGALAFLAAPSFEGPADAGANNVYDVQVQASDGTLSDTQNIAVTVTDVNEVPTAIDLSASSLDENNAAGVTVATLTATDPDGAPSGFAGPFTYALVSGVGDTDNAAFTIAGDQLKISASANFEAKSSYSIRVQVTDNGGLSYETTRTVTVNDVNEAPTAIDLSASSLEENNAAGATVATLSATDPDGAPSGFAGPFTYALVSGAGDTDNAAFTIAGDQLKINASANFEAKSSYSIRLQVTDSGGLSYVTTQVVTVTDVNEAPSAGADQNVSAAENVSDSVVLATVAGSDPDLGGGNDALNDFENVIYAITGGNAAGLFEINAAGEISLAAGKTLDYETATSHALTVTITDGPGLSDTATITIGVTDVVEGDPDDKDAEATSSTQVKMTAGAPGNGTIRGSASNDTLYGGAGDDTIYGGAGDDQIFGGNSNDKLYGGSGNDTLRGEAGVDAIYGGSGDDYIDAGGGADVTILGGLGNDTIIGSAGADVITGGGGGDTFIFASLAPGFGVDTITDFDASMDTIALVASAFGALAGGATAGLDTNEFRANAGGNALDANDFILFDTSTGNLYYDTNGSAGGQKTLIATLTGVATLDYTDFTVIAALP